MGVYLAYASRLGYTLAEGRLYLLESWFDAEYAERREKCGVPEELTFKTKPQIALEILQDTVQRGALRFRWVTADEVYGDSPQFLDGVANPGSSPGQALGKWYFAEVSCSTPVWRRRPAVVKPGWSGQGKRPKMRLRTLSHRPVRVDRIAKRLPKKAWSAYLVKEGSKGPIVCDFAFVRVTVVRDQLPGDTVWLVLRRNLEKPNEIKFSPLAMPRPTSIRQNWCASAGCAGRSRPLSNRAKRRSGWTTTRRAAGWGGITI